MKDPQKILEENPDRFVDPPMRWNTGTMQYEVDIEHVEPVQSQNRPKSWIAFWSILPLTVNITVLLIITLIGVLYVAYLLFGI